MRGDGEMEKYYKEMKRCRDIIIKRWRMEMER